MELREWRGNSDPKAELEAGGTGSESGILEFRPGGDY